MLLLRLLFLAFIALASARKRKRACIPQQQPLAIASNTIPINAQSSPPVGNVPAQPPASSAPAAPPAAGQSSSPSGQPAAPPAAGQSESSGGNTPNGAPLKASFTFYGSGDTFGSGNCNTNTVACSFFDSPGYNAAASENLFGVGPGAGAGPACRKCYKLTLNSDQEGKPYSGSITVKINNLCPAQGNPLCAQSGLTGTNQYGANVNFDLCKDGGAAGALLPPGVGVGLGTAVEVKC